MATTAASGPEYGRFRPDVCLDFANTVGWHASEHPDEWLTSYSRLLEWSREAEVLTEDEARLLVEEAARRPADAAVALERAIDLRETIYRIFAAISRDSRLQQADLAGLNGELTRALAHLHVAPTEEGYAYAWEGDELDRPIWPLARAASDLLTSDEERGRVRMCANDPCGWLFVDRSHSRSRRWCSMRDCGNRVKARRHYERRKG